jgi:hypothetical protein
MPSAGSGLLNKYPSAQVASFPSLASARVFKRREHLEGVLRCADENETAIDLPYYT